MMSDEKGEYPDYLAGSDFDSTDTPVEELQERIEWLEERIDLLKTSSTNYLNLPSQGSMH